MDREARIEATRSRPAECLACGCPVCQRHLHFLAHRHSVILLRPSAKNSGASYPSHAHTDITSRKHFITFTPTRECKTIKHALEIPIIKEQKILKSKPTKKTITFISTLPQKAQKKDLKKKEKKLYKRSLENRRKTNKRKITPKRADSPSAAAL